MGRKKTTVKVIPSARRLIHSMRDVGYDFRHSVADLVDNSIAAGASIVAIDMRFDGESSWFRISDNGRGMSSKQITEAMRFGTEREYDADELGKFGLGLKTASLSQCSRLTVASREDTNARRIEVRQWDLKHIDTTNRWEIIDVPADERPEELVEPLQERTGTVVLWEVMDRVLDYRIPWGDRARSGFFRLAEELDLHLGMVFHRFLSGEARRKKKFRMTINGTAVEPWDPFAREEKSTIKLPSRELEIHGDSGAGLVAFTPFILPSQQKFSSLKAFNRYAGPAKWNFQQGFYVYRADRMIQSGGWSYMRTSDEHTKLARAALDFWPDLDSAFELNVAKARVNLPADLRAKLEPLIEELARQARKAYKPPTSDGGHQPSPNSSSTQSRHSSSSNTDDEEDSSSARSENNSNDKTKNAGMTEHIGTALERAAAKADEVKALKKIRNTLRIESPDTATRIGW